MANIDATTLVRLTRDLVQIFGTTQIQYYDGFSAPSDATQTSILARINEFKSMLTKCRVYVSDYTTNFTVGNRYATLDPSIYEILTLFTNGYDLLQTTRNSLSSRDWKWQTRTGDDATAYFREGNRIGLDKLPLTNHSGMITGSREIPDLVNGADTFSILPESFQRRMPYGGAILLATVDSTNSAQVRRIEGYRDIVRDMLAELFRLNTGDFASPMQIETWVPQPTYIGQQAINEQPYQIYSPMQQSTQTSGLPSGS